jgi:hypothetical protein
MKPEMWIYVKLPYLIGFIVKYDNQTEDLIKFILAIKNYYACLLIFSFFFNNDRTVFEDLLKALEKETAPRFNPQTIRQDVVRKNGLSFKINAPIIFDRLALAQIQRKLENENLFMPFYMMTTTKYRHEAVLRREEK